jgi:penicillin-binding protein 1A
VFGVFPTVEDPKSSVIWEAFQPETEPRRSFRREDREPSTKTIADASRKAKARRAAQPKPKSEDFLQRQGGIY